ncbi:putative host-specificity protein [Salmonella phage 39]|nr:putative host-specificity protein [Salmonella phage 39]
MTLSELMDVMKYGVLKAAKIHRLLRCIMLRQNRGGALQMHCKERVAMQRLGLAWMDFQNKAS